MGHEEAFILNPVEKDNIPEPCGAVVIRIGGEPPFSGVKPSARQCSYRSKFSSKCIIRMFYSGVFNVFLCIHVLSVRRYLFLTGMKIHLHFM